MTLDPKFKPLIGGLFPLAWWVTLPITAASGQALLLVGALLLGARWRGSRSGRWWGWLIQIVVTAALIGVVLLFPFDYYLHWRSGLDRLPADSVYPALVVSLSGVLAQWGSGRSARWSAYLIQQVLFQAAWATAAGLPILVALLCPIALLLLAHQALSQTSPLSARPALIRLGLIFTFVLVAAIVALPTAFSPAGSPFTAALPTLPGLREAARQWLPDWRIPLPGQDNYSSRLAGAGPQSRPPEDKLPLMRVAGRPSQLIYLREHSYLFYDQGRWSTGRVRDPLPAGPRQADLRLTLLADTLSVVPHTLETDAVDLTGSQGLTNRGPMGGWTLDQALWPGDGWTLRQVSPQTEELSPTDRQTYLALPPHLEAGWTAAARRITRSTPEQTYAALAGTFRRGWHYDLQTTTPTGRDPLSQFLLTDGRGYCVHFAGATVLLARLAGLPARYVTGYTVWLSAVGQGVVTADRAHAWAEVWLPTRGWTTLETTPPFIRQDRPFTEGSQVFFQERGRGSDGGVGLGPGPDLSLLFFLALVIAGLTGLGGAIWWWGQTRRRWSVWVKRRVRLGGPTPAQVGWTGFTRTLARPGRSVSADRPGRLLAGWLLAGQPLSRRDKRYLWLWRHRVEQNDRDQKLRH